MKIMIVIILFVFVCSCSQSTVATNPKIGEEFELKYGQTIQIQDRSISIKFQRVAEDSRCPTGVVCIWEGNAKIILQVSQLDSAVNTALEPKEISISGYKIRLISVSPYPVINVPMIPEQYIIKLIVTLK